MTNSGIYFLAPLLLAFSSWVSTQETSYMPLQQEQQQQLDGFGPEIACRDNPLEVAFVMDVSTSILFQDYLKQMEFVKDVINLFDIAPNQTRVALVTFSTSVTLQFSLGEFTDKNSVMKALSNIKYMGGNTNTSAALKFLRQYVLSRRKVRSRAAKVGVIVTDGMSADPEATVREARLCREAGITLFVVGIGEEVDRAELRAITGPAAAQSHVLTVNTFDALQTIIETLAIKACETTPWPPDFVSDRVSSCQNMTDVVFAVDSVGFGMPNTKEVLTFVGSIVNRLDISQDSIHASVMLNKCQNTKDISFADHEFSEEFKDALNKTEPNSLKMLMQKVRQYGFSKENGARSKAKKMAIYFFDSKIDTAPAIQEIYRSQFLLIKTVMIAVGSELNPSKLKAGSGNYFELSDFNSGSHLEILQTICK